MSSIQHNAPSVARQLRSANQAIRAEAAAELQAIAGPMAVEMRLRAQKFRSTMANSVRVETESPLSLFVGPHVDYALYRERGRKPGKGLPRYFSAEAQPLIAWLAANPVVSGPAGPVRPGRLGRLGSARRQAQEESLRDRYMAFSRYVKAHGLKAGPFVGPTARAWAQPAAQRLAAAVRRGVAAFNASQGGAA